MCTEPDPSVITKVARVVGGSTAGRALALTSVANPETPPVACLNNGEYVLAPSSDWAGNTCPGVGSGVADKLNMYEGVAYDGVGRRIAGAVVGTVADKEENADASDAVLPVNAVVLDKGYKPINGASWPEMPKLGIQE